MNDLKSKLLPFLGMGILIFFIAMAYINNSIFLDRLLVCGLIILGIYIIKVKSNASNTVNTDRNGKQLNL